MAQGVGVTLRAGFVPHGFLAVMRGCCGNSESLCAAKLMANRRPRPPGQQDVGLQKPREQPLLGTGGGLCLGRGAG